VTAQGVYLADNLPFGYAADGWIAAHLGDFVHVHRNETSLCAQLCSSSRRLASRMACPDNYDIIFELHQLLETSNLGTKLGIFYNISLKKLHN
jgi:hypothetical protein